ncbi:MAG: amidase domain-containing protein [Angelakisella sp.]
MKILKEFPYNRQAAVNYAHQWAYRRNPAFYDFEEIGGDCTNFASQCILAGTGVMNFTETYGWYYLNVNHRSPSWTGVVYLYDFLTTNEGVGPYGVEVEQDAVQPGDICQLFMDKGRFQHSPVITVVDSPPTLGNIQVAAHSYDVDCRPLDTYNFKQIRFIHIQGYRAKAEKFPKPEPEKIKLPLGIALPFNNGTV